MREQLYGGRVDLTQKIDPRQNAETSGQERTAAPAHIVDQVDHLVTGTFLGVLMAGRIPGSLLGTAICGWVLLLGAVLVGQPFIVRTS